MRSFFIFALMLSTALTMKTSFKMSARAERCNGADSEDNFYPVGMIFSAKFDNMPNMIINAAALPACSNYGTHKIQLEFEPLTVTMKVNQAEQEYTPEISNPPGPMDTAGRDQWWKQNFSKFKAVVYASSVLSTDNLSIIRLKLVHSKVVGYLDSAKMQFEPYTKHYDIDAEIQRRNPPKIITQTKVEMNPQLAAMFKQQLGQNANIEDLMKQLQGGNNVIETIDSQGNKIQTVIQTKVVTKSGSQNFLV